MPQAGIDQKATSHASYEASALQPSPHGLIINPNISQQFFFFFSNFSRLFSSKAIYFTGPVS